MANTRMRPPYLSPDDEEEMAPGGTAIPPFDMNTFPQRGDPRMRELPTGPNNDYDLMLPPEVMDTGEGGDKIEPEEVRMRLPSPDAMLSDLRGNNNDYRHPDPNADHQGNMYRAQAVQDFIDKQGIQRPGYKTEQDYRKQYGESPDFTPPRRPPGMPDFAGDPTPNEKAGHDEAAQMSDEEILAQMHKEMDRPGTGTANPQDDDTNALAPFTGDFGKDTAILDRELAKPGADIGQLNRMFNELHGDTGFDDRKPRRRRKR